MPTVLISAGPSREYFDDVRYLSNGASGSLGIALARGCVERGWRALLALGPTHLDPPADVEVHRFVSAEDLEASVGRLAEKSDQVDIFVRRRPQRALLRRCRDGRVVNHPQDVISGLDHVRERALRKVEVDRDGFEQMGGDLFALVDDFVHRLDDSGAADGKRTGSIGAHAELDLVGIPVDDLDILDRHAEPVGDQLGEGRFVALAVLVSASKYGH